MKVVASCAFVLLALLGPADCSASYLAGNDSDKVVFNVNSLKYHIPSCSAAKRCTHCIEITRKEAKERGGVACKVCGAGE